MLVVEPKLGSQFFSEAHGFDSAHVHAYILKTIWCVSPHTLCGVKTHWEEVLYPNSI
jgi:hypothetical protein